MFKKYIPIAFLALLLAACNNQQNRFSTDIAIPVTIQEVKLSSIQEVFTATGTIVSEYESKLNTQSSGEYYLQTNPRTGKKYKMGDAVKQGDVVIKIEDREYENNVNINGAKIDLDISKMEFEKQTALYEKGGVTLREKVNGEKQWVSAQKNYENALLQLAKMKVVAPFDGVITNLPYFSQGVRIEQNKEVLQIMSYKEMVMDLMLPESQITKVSLNQKAWITNYSIPDDTLSGKLNQISPAIDIESRTFKGRLAIDNQEAKLRPGMFVKADIIVDKKDSVVVIPKDAILVRADGKAVFVARDETARERKITTGMENNGMIEVTKGLQPEERLIIKGFETLKDRSKIKVMNK
ncbi:RND family efflux transporter, MFP subunit [Saccharicrinis carchari]|uniref:RND family efflux transporter, MFP subunit n=1 Tax=Saccharicrinis carchari TaxID=1168039 RepID=A0A521E1E8_SACCC|nr:efflux RND transporter periplasmic adaptor subunit [Saccharicrinis carchari]SMO77799.1 RND family efflux transporter, MFP subunit [Saccharicrinis carchari]